MVQWKVRYCSNTVGTMCQIECNFDKNWECTIIGQKCKFVMFETLCPKEAQANYLIKIVTLNPVLTKTQKWD